MPPKKRPIHNYTEDALKSALKAVREEQRSIREASRYYGVPRGTIQDRIHGRIKEGPRKMGPNSVLTTAEEQELCNWLMEVAKCGFPRKKEDLLDTVQTIVNKNNRKTLFKNGRPGLKWYNAFLKRNAALSLLDPEGISKARSVITEESIRKWFRELEEYLRRNNAENIFNDPNRIMNGDETSFSMCPKTGKVIAPKGWKNVYEIKKGSDKETITVLLVFTASGKTLFPMVVFPYIRPPKAIIESMPSGWFLGKSETGWMKSDVFFEYVANGVHKWLEEQNIPRPVLLFIDGHKSHLTLQLSEFCHSKGIILYALPPNTTHIMQPADVSVFRPLKSQWKKTVREWSMKDENLHSVLSKASFCPLLQEVFNDLSMETTIKNGFKKCGLYPFNPNNVDYTKCVKNRIEYLEQSNESTATVQICDEDISTIENVLLKLKDNLEKCNIDVSNIITTIKKFGSESIPDTTALRENENIEEAYIEVPIANEILEMPESENMEGNELIEETNDASNIIASDITSGATEKRDTDKESVEVYQVREDGVLELINSIVPDNIALENSANFASSQIPECDSHKESNFEYMNATESNNLVITEFDRNNNQNIPIQKITEENNISVCSLKNHLFWPSPLQHTGKKNTERMPSAISSDEWRKIILEKEARKKNEAEEKLRRTEERAKRTTKLKEKGKSKRRKVTDTNMYIEVENENMNNKQKCGSCGEELESDIEEDSLKNVGCDNCPRWFHLMCTEFVGLSYEDVQNKDFNCSYCSLK